MRQLPGGRLLEAAPRPRLLAPAGLVVYLALAALVFASSWTHPFSRLIGQGMDPPLMAWFLGWSAFAITHHLDPLLSTVANVPDGMNLMWNTAYPLPAALLAPITLTLGSAFAYNLMCTLAVALSAWTAFLVIGRYVRHWPAAAVGGLLYGFSPAMMAQSLGHPFLTLGFVAPLVLLVFDDLLIRRRYPPLLMGAALGLLGAAQLLISEEQLAAIALISLLGMLLLAMANRHAMPATLTRLLPAFAVAIGVFGVLVAVPALFQFFGPQRPTGLFQQPNEYVSDLLNFVVPTPVQQIAPGWLAGVRQNFHGNVSEWGAYLGLPLLGLLVWWAIRDWSSPLVRFASVLGLTLALLSMGFTLHVAGVRTLIPVGLLALPFVALRRSFPAAYLLAAVALTSLGVIVLPMLNNLLPSRLMTLGFLFAAILLAGYVDTTLSLASHRIIKLGVAGVAMLFLIPVLPFPSEEVTTPVFFTTASVQTVPASSTALVLPFPHGGDSTAMLWQAQSGMRFRMPGSYGIVAGGADRADPPWSATLRTAVALEDGMPVTVTPELLAALRADLMRWGVTTVLIGPMPHRDQATALYQTVLGRAPERIAGVELWRLDQGPTEASSDLGFRSSP